MRAFVAVDITEPSILGSIKGLQAELAQSGTTGMRMVDAGILHFTLQFLGEVPDNAISSISDALLSVRFAPFDLEIAGVGAFPNVKSPRIIWVGGKTQEMPASKTNSIKNTAKPLLLLAQKVSDALESLGYTQDKPFKAHSTISRIKDKSKDDNITGMLKKRSNMVFGIQRVRSFKLKESRLTRGGPVYTDLAEITSETEDHRQ